MERKIQKSLLWVTLLYTTYLYQEKFEVVWLLNSSKYQKKTCIFFLFSIFFVYDPTREHLQGDHKMFFLHKSSTIWLSLYWWNMICIGISKRVNFLVLWLNLIGRPGQPENPKNKKIKKVKKTPRNQNFYYPL